MTRPRRVGRKSTTREPIIQEPEPFEPEATRRDADLIESSRANRGWWNRNAFVTPDLYTFGNSGTGILVGPDLKNLDFSLTKNFRVSESKSFDFRAEVFNIMNHPNFGSPNTQWDTALFGVVTSALDSRQVQLGLKYIF